MKVSTQQWWRTATLALTLMTMLCANRSKAQSNARLQNPVPKQNQEQTEALSILDRNGMLTSILYDRVFPLSNIYGYNGQTDIKHSNSEHFYQAYYELYLANSNKGNMLYYDQVDELAAQGNNPTTYPIGLTYYRYDYLKQNAISDNLITYQNNYYRDVAGRPTHPYENRLAAIASPLLHKNAPSIQNWLAHVQVRP